MTPMPVLPPDEDALAVLNRSVAEAVRFFSHADPDLSDGYWTAHDALAHIVFWHCQAVSVAHSLLEGREPVLAEGPRIELNHCACEELSHQPPAALAAQLAEMQGQLDVALRRMSDWNANFPVKVGGRYCSVQDRVAGIEAHIRHHVRELRRAARRKADQRVR